MLKERDLLSIQRVGVNPKTEMYIKSSDIPLKWNDMRSSADINKISEME